MGYRWSWFAKRTRRASHTSTGSGSSVPGTNVHLSIRNGSIPIFTASDEFQAAYILGTSGSIDIDPGTYKCQIGAPTQIIGNSTVLVLKSTGASTDRLSFVFDHSSSWEWSSGGSAHGIPNGLYWYNGGYRMVLMPSGNLGLGGVTKPTCTLDVQTASSLTQTNIAINKYNYNISSNTSTNLGGGPTTFSVCARFRSNIWVQDKVYSTSDSKLKRDIEPLDFTLDHFKKLRPVSFKWKTGSETKLWVIAQDMLDICGEAVSLQPNEAMEETDRSPAGRQLVVDYNSIIMMNTVAIKKLIAELDELKNRLTI